MLAWVVLVTRQVQAKRLESLNAACTRILWSKHQQYLQISQAINPMPPGLCQDRQCQRAGLQYHGVSHDSAVFVTCLADRNDDDALPAGYPEALNAKIVQVFAFQLGSAYCPPARL